MDCAARDDAGDDLRHECLFRAGYRDEISAAALADDDHAALAALVHAKPAIYAVGLYVAGLDVTAEVNAINLDFARRLVIGAL